MTDTERAELALAVARVMGEPKPQVAHIWPLGSRCLLGDIDPENPEAAIFDPTVPGTDAWEALEWLRQRCRQLAREARPSFARIPGRLHWNALMHVEDLPLAVCRAIVEAGDEREA